MPKTPALALLVLAALGLPGAAEAFPAFARAYKMPCNTCHSAITRRSEFGDAFRKNGYRWPGEAGADLHAKKPAPLLMKGVALGDGQLPAIWPFSAAGSFAATYDPDSDPEFNLGTPALNLLFGGSLGERISVFGTWSGSGSPNELYLHFKPIGTNDVMLRVGRFEQSTTVFKNNEALIGNWLLGSSAVSGHSVGQSRVGAEANGILARRAFWAVGAVRSGNVGDTYNAYYNLSYKPFGTDFTGGEPDIDLDHPSFFDDVVLVLNHWGYMGKVAGPAGDETAELMRLGLDLKFHHKGIGLWAGAMLGQDKDKATDRDNQSLTGFGELSYDLATWLIALYQYQLQDQAAQKELKQIHGAGLVALLYENVRTRLRFTRTDDGVEPFQVAELQFLFAF